MKKILCLLLSVACLFAIKVNPVMAEEDELSISDDAMNLITYESPMPIIDDQLRANELSLNETYKVSAREQWIEETKAINESVYNQEVDYIFEDSEYIHFVFKANDIEISNCELDPDNMQYTDFQVEEVAYLKPESATATMSTNANSYQTKIITYWGWSDGYTIVDSKEGIYKSIANLLITYCGPEQKAISWILGEVLGAGFDAIDVTKSARGESRNKYYYRNKYGAVYDLNQWIPVAAVGEKRAFAWGWGTAKKSSGEPIPIVKNGKQADNTTNPTNYDYREKKAHYDDNAWIMSKAIETYGYGGYWDCYAIVTNK